MLNQEHLNTHSNQFIGLLNFLTLCYKLKYKNSKNHSMQLHTSFESNKSTILAYSHISHLLGLILLNQEHLNTLSNQLIGLLNVLTLCKEPQIQHKKKIIYCSCIHVKF